jgi:D-lactate dehydrogenase
VPLRFEVIVTDRAPAPKLISRICGANLIGLTMKVAVFSTKSYDRGFLDEANRSVGNRHDLTFLDARLSGETATLAAGYQAVCAFVNDQLDHEVLSILARQGTRMIALRSAGFNHVDLNAAKSLGMAVGRVPAYSPHAVAEHTVALILSLNRKIHRAYARVREGNFSLDGLLGFDLQGRTVGIVGTGKIGLATARILHGFGCRILAFDPDPASELTQQGGTYVSLNQLLSEADIITLHCPLRPETHHLIDEGAIRSMKPGVMLINTSRGGVLDTKAVIGGLKSGAVGYLGLDVYEEEGDLFFENLSEQMIQDDVFARLLTFPNVLITGHQAFFTFEAVSAIARSTIANVSSFEDYGVAAYPVSVEKIA